MTASIALQPALQVRGLQVSLGGRPVLQDVDFSVAAGRWVSIVGPNGAGKSTLLAALAGLLPAQGQISLLGQDVATMNPAYRARSLAWMGQNEPAGEDLRAWDVVLLGRLPHQGWLAGLQAHDLQVAEQALRSTQAWDWRERSMGTLSGGERQRVLLARALAVQAPVILMVHNGRLVHQGACADTRTHRALEQVFDQRIAVHTLDGQALVLPRRAARASQQERA
ncbi:MAG: ABC transporter ATP-binding protein [Betaproteobacteria bacterium]|nr:ABC transporter ATP-binding protein [Betaproteobacteria bacterium]